VLRNKGCNVPLTCSLSSLRSSDWGISSPHCGLLFLRHTNSAASTQLANLPSMIGNPELHSCARVRA